MTPTLHPPQLPHDYWQAVQRDYDTADPVELDTMGRMQVGWRLGTVDSGHGDDMKDCAVAEEMLDLFEEDLEAWEVEALSELIREMGSGQGRLL